MYTKWFLRSDLLHKFLISKRDRVLVGCDGPDVHVLVVIIVLEVVVEERDRWRRHAREGDPQRSAGGGAGLCDGVWVGER